MSAVAEEVKWAAPNRSYSVYPQAVFKGEHVIRRCLKSFPWLWVSVDIVSIDDTWLMVPPLYLDSKGLIFFILTELTMV